MKVITSDDFSDDFEVSDKVRLKKIVPEVSSLPIKSKSKYLLTPVTGISYGDTFGGADLRSFILIDDLTGIGIIHLDFTSTISAATTTQTTPIFTIPEECPTVHSIIENALGAGSIFVVPDDRQVYVKRIQNRYRHIVNLVGFFKV